LFLTVISTVQSAIVGTKTFCVTLTLLGKRLTRCVVSSVRYGAVKNPVILVKSFRIEVKDENGGWVKIYEDKNNYQRLAKIPVDVETTAVRLIPEETWALRMSEFSRLM